MTALRTKNTVKYSIVALISLLILGYSYLKLRDIISGPDITLIWPPNGASLSNPLVTIKGKTERITQLYLNGRKIFTDEKGNFSEPILMAKGYNVFEVKAQDKFGRQAIEKLEVLVD